MASQSGGNSSGHSKQEVVLDEKIGHVGLITLNNPFKLNIITLEVSKRLAELYEKWEKANDVEIIIIKGAGRAFSAGGDLRMFYHGKAGRYVIETFYKTYWLLNHIHTYKKPLVAFVHGIAMGGGAVLVVPSTFTIVTEKTVTESNVEENQWAKETISTLKSSSPTGLKMTLKSVQRARSQTLTECLKKEFRLTANTLRGVLSNDMYEGMRALVIDKDNSPKWNPSTLGEITEEKLDLVFQPFEEKFELQLPQEEKIPRWEGKFESSGYNLKPFIHKM